MAIVLSAAIASATPSVEPKCRFGVIKHPPNGAGVMFDEACTTAYVNPPLKGIASVAGLAQNANLQFCPTVLGINDAVKPTLDGVKLVNEKVLKMIKDFEPLSRDVQDLGAKVNAASAKKGEADGKLEAAARRKTELRDDLVKAKSAYDDCVALHSPAECAEAAAAHKEAKEAYRKHIAEVHTPAENAAFEAKSAYDQAFDDYTQKTKKLAEALEPLFDLQKRLFELQEQVFQLYAKYAVLEGATGQLLYEVPWDRLVAGYQAANPDLRVTWQPMPIKEAKFMASAVIEATQTSIPALLSARVPGMPPFGPASMPTGNGKVEPAPKSPSGVDLGRESIGFGTSISAQIKLSLAGACPYFPKGVDTSPESPKTINFNQLTAHVVANASYTYEVKARRAYHAKYNMASWMTRLERRVKQGGFFSSKTLHEVVEDGNSSDWFSITFDQQASEHGYTNEEKARITKEVKGQLMERALKLVAIQNGTFQAPPRAPNLAPTGAGAAASYLMGGCGFFSWCAVGGWILGTLDSIFGRSEAVSNFKRTNNVWLREDVDDAVVLERTGGLTFAP